MADPSFAAPKSEFQLGEDDLQLSDYERELASKLLRPETFLSIAEGDRLVGYLAERLAIAGLSIPISQIQGFSGFTVQVSPRINTLESTTSATYTDLATVGPQLTDLEPGAYLLLCVCNVSAPTISGLMSFSINGSTPSDDEAARSDAGNIISFIKTNLTQDGANTVKLQYRSSSGGTSAGFERRQLFALKISNL